MLVVVVGSGVARGVGVVEDGLAVSADGVVVAVVDAGGGVVADAGVAVVVVVVGEQLVDEAAGMGQVGEALGESWCLFDGLGLGFAVGVVVGDVGRLWLRVTPRSARSWATVLEVIELPRSACRVSCPALMCSAVAEVAISSSARRADSVRRRASPRRSATTRPTRRKAGTSSICGGRRVW